MDWESLVRKKCYPSTKKLNEQELLNFRSKFDIPIKDEDCILAPFYKPSENSEEIKYLKERREALGGFIPERFTDNKNY